VNLATKTAYVDYDSEKVHLPEMEKAIRDAGGYQVVDETVVIKIGGMVCAMCVGTLEIALKKLDGVAEVRVNLASEKAHVTYNSRMATLVDLRRIIEETGYQHLGILGEEAAGNLEKEAREKDLQDKTLGPRSTTSVPPGARRPLTRSLRSTWAAGSEKGAAVVDIIQNFSRVGY